MSIVPLLDDRTAGSIIDGTFLSPLVTTTRASNATAFNSSGVLTTFANNILRPDYNPSTLAFRGWLIEGARTNSLRNSGNTGAVVGTIGSGGVYPTNWTSFNTAGVTREVVAVGTENGLSYVDLRFSGTPSATNTVGVSFDNNTQIAALNGQTWTSSYYTKVIGGSGTNIVSYYSFITERNGAGGFLVESQNILSTSISTASLAASRMQHSRTLNNASTAFTANGFTISCTSGSPIDITIRVGERQHELGAFASSQILTTTATATRAADIPTGLLSAIGGNSTQGTMFAEFEYMAQNAGGVVWAIDNGSTIADLINLRRLAGTPANMTFEIQSGGVGQVSNTHAAIPANTVIRSACAWENNNFASIVTGTALVNDTVGTLPTNLTTFRLGLRNNGAPSDFGFIWLRNLTFNPTRVADGGLTSYVS